MTGISNIKFKNCRICKERKPIEQFHRCKKWYASYCKKCQSEFYKIWAEENKDYLKEYKRKAFQEMPKEKKWSAHLKNRYGITNEEYLKILSSQKGVCKICKEKGTRLRLSVDHNHLTGKVRGLLCERCNSLLGRINDDPEILKRAINYLRRRATK